MRFFCCNVGKNFELLIRKYTFGICASLTKIIWSSPALFLTFGIICEWLWLFVPKLYEKSWDFVYKWFILFSISKSFPWTTKTGLKSIKTVVYVSVPLYSGKHTWKTLEKKTHNLCNREKLKFYTYEPSLDVISPLVQGYFPGNPPYRRISLKKTNSHESATTIPWKNTAFAKSFRYGLKTFTLGFSDLLNLNV